MFLPFVAGVVMAMLGVALLIQGQGRLGSRTITKAWARRLGVFLLLFFPVILLERFLLTRFDADEEIDRMVVHGCITVAWVAAGVVMLLIAVRRPAHPRVGRDSADTRAPLEAADAFDASALPDTALGDSPPAPKERSRPGRKVRSPEAKNPFDFE